MAKKKEPEELVGLRKEHSQADSDGDYTRMAQVEQKIRDFEARAGGYATGGVVEAPPVELESTTDQDGGSR